MIIFALIYIISILILFNIQLISFNNLNTLLIPIAILFPLIILFIIYKKVPKEWVDASAFYSRKDYKQAEMLFTKYLELYPNDIKSRLKLGICQLNIGDYEKAIESFHLLMKIRPLNKLASLNCAKSYNHMKEYEKALKFCLNTLKLDSKDKEAKYLRKKIESVMNIEIE